MKMERKVSFVTIDNARAGQLCIPHALYRTRFEVVLFVIAMDTETSVQRKREEGGR